MHVTVTERYKAGIDLVLIQPFLLSHVNLVSFMLTSIFLSIFIGKQRSFVSKQLGQTQLHIHSNARVLSPLMFNGP